MRIPGGIHWHKFLKITSNDSKKLTPQQIAELAMQNINRDPVALHTIRSLDIILADELGQLSAEFACVNNQHYTLQNAITIFFGKCFS